MLSEQIKENKKMLDLEKSKKVSGKKFAMCIITIFYIIASSILVSFKYDFGSTSHLFLFVISVVLFLIFLFYVSCYFLSVFINNSVNVSTYKESIGSELKPMYVDTEIGRGIADYEISISDCELDSEISRVSVSLLLILMVPMCVTQKNDDEFLATTYNRDSERTTKFRIFRKKYNKLCFNVYKV